MVFTENDLSRQIDLQIKENGEKKNKTHEEKRKYQRNSLKYFTFPSQCDRFLNGPGQNLQSTSAVIFLTGVSSMQKPEVVAARSTSTPWHGQQQQ